MKITPHISKSVIITRNMKPHFWRFFLVWLATYLWDLLIFERWGRRLSLYLGFSMVQFGVVLAHCYETLSRINYQNNNDAYNTLIGTSKIMSVFFQLRFVYFPFFPYSIKKNAFQIFFQVFVKFLQNFLSFQINLYQITNLKIK